MVTDLETIERIWTQAAMSQWERSLCRPEPDRKRPRARPDRSIQAQGVRFYAGGNPHRNDRRRWQEYRVA